MKAGALGRVVDHFFEDPRSQSDIERAVCEFFGVKSVDDVAYMAPDFEKTDSDEHRLFCEWFLFHFTLASGQTILRAWYENNPEHLASEDLEFYAELLKDNEYGFFEVLTATPGRVEVASLSSGKRYVVREYEAAPFLKQKEVIVGRIGRVGERYEFMSGMIHGTDTEFTERACRELSLSRSAMSPKDIYYWLHAPRGKPSRIPGSLDSSAPSTTTLAEARERLGQSLRSCDVMPFVSVRTVERWLRTAAVGEETAAMSLLMGLASDDAPEDAAHELVRSAAVLNNMIRTIKPRAEDDTGSLSRGETRPRFRHDVFEPFAWHPIYFRGVKHMREGDVKKALALFNQAFHSLLEQKTTTREVYRLFANKGESMYQDGDPAGLYFFKIALMLNPRYDFAKKMLALHHKELTQASRTATSEGGGWIAPFLMKFLMRSKKAPKIMGIEDDPAYRYYQWLTQFGISFSRHTPPPTKMNISKVR